MSLSGKTILVTRPRHQAGELVERFERLGAKVLVQPAIRIEPPDSWVDVDAALQNLDRYDWIVFSSTNGVDFFCRRFRALFGKDPDFSGLKVAAIGSGTADELESRQIRVELVPEQFRAESLADALVERAAGKRFLLPRASRGRRILSDRLLENVAEVDEVVVYLSRDISVDDPGVREVAEQLEAGAIDWVTVTSSAIGRSLDRLFGEHLERAKLATISPITSAAMRELGHEPSAEAVAYTMVGLVEAIVENEKKEK